MKLLLCHNHYQQLSGEDIVLQEAHRLLGSAGHEVIPYFRMNTELVHMTLWEKAQAAASCIYSFRAYDSVREIIRRERPEVAMVQNVFPLISPSVYRAVKGEGLPIVQLVYNYRFFCSNGVFFTQGKVCERCLKGNFLNGVIRKCYRNSYWATAVMAASLGVHRAAGTFLKTIDRLVVPDAFLKKKMMEGGFPEDRIVIIQNPFDLSGYEPSSDHDDYILFVGRLVREKGIFTLLEAVKNKSRIRLLIVGDGPERESVQRTIRQNNLHHVTFVGPRYGDDLKKLLSRAWFVIFPSEWYDNGPMVIYQSFAMGKPVVASQIDGIPELVIENETGLLFPPGDSASLADRIERLASDEQTTQRLGRQARRFAEEKLGSGVYLNALNSLLRSLA